MKQRPSVTAAPYASTEPPSLGLLGRLGDLVLRVGAAGLQFVGDTAIVFARGVTPGRWRRTMREEFLDYLFRVGVRPIPVVLVAALLVGIGLVQQILYWLVLVGQQGSIGSFLVLVMVREVAPVVTALILIGRSGSVLLDEVGHMQVDGQLRMLRSTGIDPVDFIAVPRCFAMAVSVCLLTIVFVYAALWSGYIAASLTGLTSVSLLDFADNVLTGMTFSDHLLLLIKPLIIGFLIGYIPIWLGMRVDADVLSVRRMLPRAFVYSLLATFLVGATISAVL